MSSMTTNAAALDAPWTLGWFGRRPARAVIRRTHTSQADQSHVSFWGRKWLL